MEGINHSVTRHVNLPRCLFRLQVTTRKRRRREIIRSNTACNLPIHLFRPRVIDVVSSQTSLHMPHGNLLVEGGEGRSSTGCCISVYQYDIGRALLEHVTQTRKDASRNIIQVLPLRHNVEVIVRFDIKDGQHLIQHFAMLARDAHDGLKLCWRFLELFHQRAHLNGFRSCTKDQHYFLHCINFLLYITLLLSLSCPRTSRMLLCQLLPLP